ncbi:MAG: hypothetical protein IIB00_09325, partial [candidate division Zixibacteria bacterium]|nr:hypothetical protein [candidate division Zixibacteria bacterium]
MPKIRNQSALTTIDLPTVTRCEAPKTLKANKSGVMRYLVVLLLLASLLISSRAHTDDSEVERNARAKREINLVIQEIYWRVRAQDYTVFWENELTYFREENPLPKYLARPQFTGPGHASGDSSISTYLDSVTIVADTAIAHLTTFVVSTRGDTGQVYTPQTLLFEAGRWKKAMSSTLLENEIYFDKIKTYREAAENESSGN